VAAWWLLGGCLVVMLAFFGGRGGVSVVRRLGRQREREGEKPWQKLG
jgi:hypothetical protein